MRVMFWQGLMPTARRIGALPWQVDYDRIRVVDEDVMPGFPDLRIRS